MGVTKRLCVACAEDGRHAIAKYRCPACDVASCSLACVKKHKAQTGCSGIRNRAAHVRKAEYTDAHLMSDYTFLEDTARALDSAVCTRQSTAPYVNGRSSGGYNVLAPGISKNRMKMLTREAAKRSIHLRFMPRGYARHARNSSYVRTIPEPDPPLPPEQRKETRDKAIFWHLDVYFASCGKCPGTKLIKVDACEEEQSVADIVRGAIGALQKGRKRRRSDIITCTSKANDGYTKYIDAEVDELEVFLRNEQIASSGGQGSPKVGAKATGRNEFDLNRYVGVETNLTLRQILSGRVVVEFPVFHLAFKGSKEAKELTAAISGIFEKPEESSGSGSSSESESEDDKKESNVAMSDTSVPRPLSCSNPQADVRSMAYQPPTTDITAMTYKPATSNGITDVRTVDEPPLKKHKTGQAHTEIQDEGSAGDKLIREHIAKSAEAEEPTKPVGKSIEVPANEGISMNTSTPKGIKREPVVQNRYTSVVCPVEKKVEKDEFLEAHGPLPANENDVKVEDRSGVDSVKEEVKPRSEDVVGPSDAASRGSGFHLQQPFTKDSFKAILDTRIPRKPRQERSNSAKQSSSAKLTATG